MIYLLRRQILTIAYLIACLQRSRRGAMMSRTTGFGAQAPIHGGDWTPVVAVRPAFERRQFAFDGRHGRVSNDGERK
jgi:hypothetical protein